MIQKSTQLITVFVILICLHLQAQSGYHTPSSIVTFAAYNEDRSKLLTASPDEIILYDCVNKKEIWKLLPSQLNLTMTENPHISASIDEKLNLLRVCGNKSGCTFLDISRWYQEPLEGTIDCTANGYVLMYEVSKKMKYGNNYDYYLYNQITKSKILLATNCNKAHVFSGSTIIGLYFNNKDFNLDKTKSIFYDTAMMKFVKDPIPNFKSNEFGFYRDNKKFVSSGKEKRIYIVDLLKNTQINFDSKHSPVDYSMERINIGFVTYGWAKGTVDVLEYEEINGLKYSYICTYDIENGAFLNKIELSDDKQKDVAQKIINERREIYNKLNNNYTYIDNTTLNNFKSIAGKKVYHGPTKHVFSVVANQNPDANGKVKIKAICFDKKKEVYETISITDLLNKNVYTVINNHMTCTDCFGSGKFSNTSERTVWDATISAGAKIIETNTVKGTCSKCGGYGTMPIF